MEKLVDTIEGDLGRNGPVQFPESPMQLLSKHVEDSHR
jgi:hypothetical protein